MKRTYVTFIATIVLSALIGSISATKIIMDPFETILIGENFMCRDGEDYDNYLVTNLRFNSSQAPVSFMLKISYSVVDGSLIYYDELSVVSKNEFNGKLTGRVTESPAQYILKNNANVCTIVDFTLKGACEKATHNIFIKMARNVSNVMRVASNISGRQVMHIILHVMIMAFCVLMFMGIMLSIVLGIILSIAICIRQPPQSPPIQRIGYFYY